MSTHVFLTRFNMPANRVEASIFSDEWLRERVELFERFTVPSVRAQDADRVGWLVFLDDRSPGWLKSRMAELESEGLLRPHYLDGPLAREELTAFVRDVVADLTGPEDTRVVTSNLDNDDGLAHNFASRLRAAAEHAPTPAALYLVTGLIHHLDEVYLRNDADNAFGAVVDDLTNPEYRTCWAEWHNRLAQIMPSVDVADGQPAWLQVVHGRNVSNRVRGRISDPRLHRSTFPGLLEDLRAPTRGAVLRDTLVRRPVRLVRDELRGPVARRARVLLGTERFEDLKSRIRRSR